MEENFQQKIEARLAELPTQVQEAIASSDFEEKIRTICRAHNLHVDQMQAVADETTLAMLGFIDMDSLASGLEEQAHLPREQAKTVAAAITHEVFMPIRESMKAWAANRKEKEASMPAPATDTAPVHAKEAPTPSVMMPSSSAPVVPPIPVSIQTPSAIPNPAPSPILAPKPAVLPNLGAAEAILSEKKVTPPAAAPTPTAPTTPAANPVSKVDPAQPQNYKADPYREPVE